MVRNCSAVCLVSGQVLHLWEFISLTSTPVFCPCSQDLSQKDTIRKCWPVKCLFHTVSVPAAKSLKLHCCLCYLSFSGQIPAGMIKKCTEGSAVAAETAVVQLPPWDFLPRTHFRSPEEFFLYIFFSTHSLQQAEFWLTSILHMAVHTCCSYPVVFNSVTCQQAGSPGSLAAVCLLTALTVRANIA